jgi:hypothetical protein
MNFVTLTLSQCGTYSYQESSSIEMDSLGFFLCDIGCRHSIYREWALADKTDPYNKFGYGCGTNTTSLEEDDNGNIHIVDAIGDDDEYYIPGRIIVTRQQFVQLLDDWEEKVCKIKPKEVIIKHDNDQFSIETNE